MFVTFEGLDGSGKSTQADLLRARLEAQASGRPPVFPDEVKQRRPNLVETQQRAYEARKTELDSALNVLKSSLAQKEQESRDLANKLQTITSNLEISRVKLQDLSTLIKDRLVSRDDYRKQEAEVEDLATACRLLVATEGALGARVYWNGDVRRLAAPAADQVDPTGAGDIFAASFFIRLHQTRDPWEAARYANVLAARSVAWPGISGVPSPSDVQQAGLVLAR